MRKRLRYGVVMFVVVLAAAQLVRPDRSNPPTDASHTIQAQPGSPSELVAILDRSCRDCHSNRTVWPSYTRVAPLSWLMAYAVTKGRDTLNFSEWTAYTPERQLSLLALSCADATSGKMPGAYTLLHEETRLTDRDVETICAAARESQAHLAQVSKDQKP